MPLTLQALHAQQNNLAPQQCLVSSRLPIGLLKKAVIPSLLVGSVALGSEANPNIF
jgi:hypothetical protein